MVAREGTARTYWHQAMEHAVSGSPEEAHRLANTARSMNRAGDVSDGDLRVLDCLIALRQRDEAAAKRHLDRIVSNNEAAELLRTWMHREPNAMPHQARRFVEDALTPPERSGGHSRMRWVGFAAVFGLAIGAGVLLSVFALPTTPNSEDSPDLYAVARENVGLVIVRARMLRDSGEIESVPIAVGSCFAISAYGLVATNKHVIDEAKEVQTSHTLITGWDAVVAFGAEEDQWYDARVLHQSEYRDIAVLKIDREFPNALTFAPEYRPGEPVFVAGFPDLARQWVRVFNLESTLARISSGIEKSAAGESLDLEEYLGKEAFVLSITSGVISAIRDTESMGRIVQTDAPGQPGNSGGPLLNENGEVIGVLTSRTPGTEAMNWAISWETMEEDLGHIRGIEWPARTPHEQPRKSSSPSD